jgi:hypothetical protein
MHFESQPHTSHPVADAAEAVRLVHDDAIGAHRCPIWTNANGHRIALVADHHCDDSWKEVAVVNLDTREQYESITFGWIRTYERKLESVQKCELGQFVFRKDVTVPLDGDGEDLPARFDCGCCGELFTSTIKEQAPLDQDAGYGICPSCMGLFATTA